MVPLRPFLSSKQSFLRGLCCSKNFLLKKFSRVVVYCSVIKVPVVLSQATALIFYQIRSALSRTFFFFFSFRCLSRVSFDILPFSRLYVNHFLQVFQLFLPVFNSPLYMVALHDIIHNFTLNIQKLLGNFSSSLWIISNGERGI